MVRVGSMLIGSLTEDFVMEACYTRIGLVRCDLTDDMASSCRQRTILFPAMSPHPSHDKDKENACKIRVPFYDSTLSSLM
jgi:hypothetical protein